MNMQWIARAMGLRGLLGLPGLLGLMLAAASPAAAGYVSSLQFNYFTVAGTDRDANRLTSGSFSNEVQSRLGPHGLPVLNTAAYGCALNCFVASAPPSDVLSTGEITYWSPSLNNGGANGTSDVVYTGSAATTLPFSKPSNFFPPNGTGANNSNGFQAALLTGSITVPTAEIISFSIGADDMAFAYLDGALVCSLGGVHSSTVGTCVTPFQIAAGKHGLELFFVDINRVQSGLSFDIATTAVPAKPTAPVNDGVNAQQAIAAAIPEPGTLALLAGGVFALGLARRRG